MFFTVTKEGLPLRKRRYFYSESFLVIGFAEYYLLRKNEEDLALAVKYFDLMWNIYSNPASDPFKITPKENAEVRALRSNANPMVLISSAQTLKRITGNSEYYDKIIEKILASEDTAYYDLTLKGAAELNEKTKMLKNVYYFSYSTKCVFEGPITGRYYPEISMNPLFVLTTSPDICTYDKDELFGIPVDESWRLNDGVVSTKSAMYPEGEPHIDYNTDNIETGIWNVMPVMESTDHTDFMGMFYSPVKIRKFYSSMCELVCTI
jgi:hypothetical protein